MKIKVWSIFIFCAPFFLVAQDLREINYIIKYAKLAVNEMQLYKIPASITLSQGILETGGGQSRLAEQANNHFGIKCKEEWTGEKIYHDDDELGECFRKYPSVDDSFRDHSRFLSERPYYKRLFTIPLTDYKAWAYGLKKSDYATNPNYAGILISKIEKYKLSSLDQLTLEEVDKKLMELYPEHVPLLTNPIQEKETELTETENSISNEVTTSFTYEKDPLARIKTHPNGLDYIVVEKGETIASIAEMYNISEKKLLVYNDLINPILIQEGQYLFFAMKKSYSEIPEYVVKKNDTMYLISQKLGIKVRKLYQKNHMKYGQEPMENQVLFLR